MGTPTHPPGRHKRGSSAPSVKPVWPGRRCAGAGASIPKQRPLIDVEIDVHRIDGHDRGQQRLAAAGIHQVADVRQCATDLAVDGCSDLGKVQVELRFFDFRVCLTDGSGRRGLLGRPDINLFAACRIAAPVNRTVRTQLWLA